MKAPETFDHYLERTLADSGLQSYGHNEFDQVAERACYKRAMGCFYPSEVVLYGSKPPMGEEGPPWGIHTEDPQEAHHGLALADDDLPQALLPTPDLGKVLTDWISTLPDVEDAPHKPTQDDRDEDWLTNPKDKAASTKVPMWSLPAIGAVHGAMATGEGIYKGYGSYNWREKPISMMEHIGALERHIAALKDGEDFVPDSDLGVTHLGCINAGAAIILDAQQCGTLIDDRPRAGVSTSADTLEDYHGRNSES